MKGTTVHILEMDDIDEIVGKIIRDSVASIENGLIDLQEKHKRGLNTADLQSSDRD